jgi:hypothetical protein
MTVHHFGTTVDGSTFVEQVPLTPPASPTLTAAPQRPPRATHLSVRDHVSLSALPDIQTQDYGYWDYTTTDIPSIDVSSDGFANFATFFSKESTEGSMNAGATADTALTTANAANTTANQALAAVQAIPGQTWDTLANKPLTFPPSPHSHPASQLSDSTVVGRAVITAADATAARAAIGAGTGNGTSNLTLGTTATTAAAGNHVHSASAVTFTPAGSLTATNVQAAIEQAASSGGGGASEIKTVLYSGGAYEALPTNPDPAWRVVEYRGPDTPTPPGTAAYANIQFDWFVRS